MAATMMIGANATMANALDKPPAVFLSPHSDDIVLSMSSAIAQHLRAGRSCLFVLMTAGGSQWVLDAINNKLTNDVNMTAAINSRIAEFKDESAAYDKYGSVLGYQLKNFTDGSLSYDQVSQTIRDIEAKYPGSDFKVMSYGDSHRDHAMCGKVARDLAGAGKIKAPRYYVKHDDIESGRANGLGWWREEVNGSDVTIVKEAAASYKLWAPDRGRYAFGYTSVPASFAKLDSKPVSYVHA